MMIQRHEGSVDNNAERDEEVDEGVEDNDGEKLGQFDITITAVPHTHNFKTLCAEITNSFF